MKKFPLGHNPYDGSTVKLKPQLVSSSIKNIYT